jgi:hypothetical protein
MVPPEDSREDADRLLFHERDRPKLSATMQA